MTKSDLLLPKHFGHCPVERKVVLIYRQVSKQKAYFYYPKLNNTILAMKTLILFDSYFGNTEQIARAIAKAFDPATTVSKRIDEATPGDLDGINLLIVGSPTRGFRPTEEVTAFFKNNLPANMSGINVAVFDTRIALETIKSKALRFMVNTGGYAASTMAKQLTKKHATLISNPEGFLVTGEQGPLKEGELERAFKWGKQLH
jgi:flavodoxin I